MEYVWNQSAPGVLDVFEGAYVDQNFDAWESEIIVCSVENATFFVARGVCFNFFEVDPRRAGAHRMHGAVSLPYPTPKNSFPAIRGSKRALETE